MGSICTANASLLQCVSTAQAMASANGSAEPWWNARAHARYTAVPELSAKGNNAYAFFPFSGFSACALNCPRSTSAAFVGNFPPREIRKLRMQFSCATELRACAIPNARIRTFPFSGICAYSPDGNPVRFYPSATYMVRAIGVPLLTESGRVDLPFCSGFPFQGNCLFLRGRDDLPLSRTLASRNLLCQAGRLRVICQSLGHSSTLLRQTSNCMTSRGRESW